MSDKAIKSTAVRKGRKPGPGTPFLMSPWCKLATAKTIPRARHNKPLCRSRLFIGLSLIFVENAVLFFENFGEHGAIFPVEGDQTFQQLFSRFEIDSVQKFLFN